MTAEAEKVTGVPWHTLTDEGEMEMLTVVKGTTSMVRVSEVAGLLEIQVVNEEEHMHETWSPFDGVKLNSGLLVPALIPLTFH